MAGVPQTPSHQSVLPHPHQHHHSVASDTQPHGQCIYNDPSVFVKTEYDQDSPNPSSAIASAMSPAESGVTSGVATTGAGTSDGTGGLGGHHGHPAAAAAIAANNASSSSSTSPSTTAAAAAVFGGGAAAAAAALWSKAPPSAAAAAAAAAAIYGEDFPMEARYALTGWLDLYFNEELELGNPEHEEHARRLIMNMVQQLETKAASEADFSSKSRLEEVIENIKQRYGHNPMRLYHVVYHCLHQERSFVQKAEMQMTLEGSSSGAISTSEAAYHIQQQLNELKKTTQDCGLEIERTRQMQETHSLNFYKHHQISVQLEGGQFQENSQEYTQYKQWRDSVAAELKQSFNTMKRQTSMLSSHHLHMTKQLKELQFHILDQELNKWKRDQQLSGNGAPFANNLDQIQKWCEDLAEIIWLNRQQIRQLEMIQDGLNIPNQEMTMNILPEIKDGLELLLDSLVKSSFVIEKQPPQVLKTNTRFSATVRLLVGTKLNVHMNPPIVTVSIISEAQANSLLRAGPTRKSKAEYSSGEILNNKQTMEYHQATGQLSVSFRNMSLKKIKRAEKKGTESVMDEKFALLFWSEFSVGNGEFSHQVCAPSLPVVVIVHGNQEPHAWATILWDNAFAEWGRQPFLVPDKVPWSQLAKTLNIKFRASCGMGLSEDNLRYLASKAFRSHGYNHDFSSAMMSWSQFCKEPLPDRSFTFWDWFHAVMKLTKEDLRGLWIDGSLLGFIPRQEAEEYLHKSDNGTFLIRFSDSELGGVTVAWITVNETSGQREVAMLQPFSRKDLSIRSLPDRIYDCVQMVMLYPNKPKEAAFAKYYSQPHDATPQQRNLRNGYVSHHLVNVIQGHSSSSNNRTMDSNSEAGTTPLDHHVATGLPLLPPAATGAAAGMAPYSPPPPSHTPTSSPAPPPTQSQTHSHMLSHQQQRHHEFQEQQHNHQQQQLLHRLSGCGSRGKVSMHNNSLPE